MRSSRQVKTASVVAAAVFVAVPIALLRYGAKNCFELACIGPEINAVLHAITIVPLLVLWVVRRRLKYPVMLACAEIGMIVATLRRDFDFSPQFMLMAILIGLGAGAILGMILEADDRTFDADR